MLKNIERFENLINFDKELIQENFVKDKINIAIGVDEVGRGCLAGPVCTAAYGFLIESLNEHPFDQFKVNKLQDQKNIHPKLQIINELNDSKKLNAKKRKGVVDFLALFNEDQINTYSSINFQAAKSIDEIGIVNSIWRSMSLNIKNAAEHFAKQTTNKLIKQGMNLIILVDGPKTIKNLENIFEKQFSKNIKLEISQNAIVRGDSHSALIAAASNIAKETRDEYMKSLAKDFEYYAWDKNVGYGTKKHCEAIKQHGLCSEHRHSFTKSFTK